MEQTFELNRTSRKLIAPFLEDYTLDQLNTIPEGFSNNLFWNIAHVVVTQQLLIYKLSGLNMLVSDELVDQYRKGTKPEQPATQADVDLIKSLLFDTIDQTQADYGSGVFTQFTEYPTSSGFVLKNVKDAMAYNNFHEGLHLGIMMSMRKLL
jgi:DinB superfamily